MTEPAKLIDQKIAIYAKYVESAVKVLDQRISMNNAFWAANLAVTGAVLWAMRDDILLKAAISLALLFMIGLNIFWLAAIASLRQLSSIKFEVIGELEKDLPSAPFQREWELLSNRNYRPLTRIDAAQVLVAILFYAVMLVYLWTYR